MSCVGAVHLRSSYSVIFFSPTTPKTSHRSSVRAASCRRRWRRKAMTKNPRGEVRGALLLSSGTRITTTRYHQRRVHTLSGTWARKAEPAPSNRCRDLSSSVRTCVIGVHQGTAKGSFTTTATRCCAKSEKTRLTYYGRHAPGRMTVLNP